MKTDICIIGGGMNGLACAIGLAADHPDMSITVVDRESHARILQSSFDGRTTAIAYGMHNMLNNLGVWATIADHAEPITQIKVVDGDSPRSLDFGESGSDNPMGFIVENHIIRKALVKRVQQLDNITCLTGRVAENISDNTVTLDDESSISTTLLIGADGRNSFVRKSLRIPARAWQYGQTAMVFIIKHEKPHNGLAFEKFLPQGPLAVLPMKGNQSQVVWSLENDRASDVLALDDEGFIAEFARHFTDFGTVELASRKVGYPLNLIHAHSYATDNACLIGDAAHGIHPIAGQGLNLGMRDVAELLDTLKDGFDAESLPALLKRYAQKRRPDVVAMIAATDGLNKLFSNTSKILKAARRFGLGIVRKSPTLKGFFMLQAMGTDKNMPALFQNETHKSA